MITATRSTRPMASGEAPRVGAHSPWSWLRRGGSDLLRHPVASLAYGGLVVALGYAVLVLGQHPLILAGAITGFLLVGPIFAAGLCELSRRAEAGADVGFDESLEGVSRNRGGLSRFAGILLAIGVSWFFLSYLLLTGLLGSAAPAMDLALWDTVLPRLDIAHVIAYVAAGGVLAAIVLSISVVSVPLLIDRQATAREAISASLTASCRYPLVVVVWGLLILVLVAVGFATALLGLVVLYPLLGHASWYAYRDLMDASRSEGAPR